MNTNRFFSISDDKGFMLHETAEEAKAACKIDLKEYRDDASFNGEWALEAESVMWGEIKERAIAIPCAEGGADYSMQGFGA